MTHSTIPESVVSAKRFNTWTVTHTGWFLLCPLWLADIDTDAPVPIPRHVPDWWFDFNLWLNNGVQWLISLHDPDATGFLLNFVKRLPSPFEIPVEAEGDE